MTTTEASLDRVEDIVDEYLRLDLGSIFLRPLSPYGFAIKTKQFARYGGREWLAFYERGLRYIIEVNKRGRHFPEFYASLLLKRMLSDRADRLCRPAQPGRHRARGTGLQLRRKGVRVGRRTHARRDGRSHLRTRRSPN